MTQTLGQIYSKLLINLAPQKESLILRAPAQNVLNIRIHTVQLAYGGTNLSTFYCNDLHKISRYIPLNIYFMLKGLYRVETYILVCCW